MICPELLKVFGTVTPICRTSRNRAATRIENNDQGISENTS